MTKPNIPTQIVVDPFAILLPPHIYQKIIEYWHPHEPLVVALERALAKMTLEEKTETLSRVKQVKDYIEAIEKVTEKVTH
jgi:hypothetical protein